MPTLEKSARRFHLPSEARGLVEEIESIERTEPIIALTCRMGGNRTALSSRTLSERVRGDVAIWCLETREMTLALSQELAASSLVEGATPCPYNGAAMIWWPIDESVSRVPCRLIIDRSGVYDESKLEEIAREIDTGPVVQTKAHTRPSYELVEEEKKRRIESERENQRAFAENRKLAGQLRDERRERSRLKKELTKKQADAVRPKPHETFTEDVAVRWVDLYMQPGGALPAFSVGKGFEDSIRECELVDRDLVVDVAAKLVAGLTGSLDVHALRTGKGGNDPQRVRAKDGARAFRCAVKRNSPGAPRLHYWKLAHGQIELAQVAHHDNERIES